MSAPLLLKPVSGSHDLSVLDLSTQRLQELSLPLPRSFPEDYGLTLLPPSASFMLAGGCASGTYAMLPHCYIVTVPGQTVREVASLPLALKGLRLVFHGGVVYSVGGCAEGRDHIEPQKTCFAYKFALDVWVRLADMPQEVVFPGVVVKDGEIWATGGFLRTDEGAHVLDLIQIYSVERNEWRVASFSLLRPSYLHGHCVLADGRVLVFCGLRDKNSNRFSYVLGTESRAVLPEKVSMSIIDPPVLLGNTLYAFNDEMSLLVYSLQSDTWTVVIDPETMGQQPIA